MSVLTIGGDMRYAYLTALAASRPMGIAAVGLERAPMQLPAAALDDIPHASAVILPNPWRSGIVLPFSAHSFTTEDVLSRLKPGALLLLSDVSGMPDELRSSFSCVDLSACADSLLKNAHLTAEAALFSAMRDSDRALGDSMCLIIGYGRIARRLAYLLKSMGAQTAVAVRREEVLLQAQADGINAFLMEDLPTLLPRAHFIFSTPPAEVLTGPLLSRIQPDALLMDLASPPFGFSLDLARSLGLHASRESGLPGRCCPLSAARILLDSVLEALDTHPKGGSSCL